MGRGGGAERGGQAGHRNRRERESRLDDNGESVEAEIVAGSGRGVVGHRIRTRIPVGGIENGRGGRRGCLPRIVLSAVIDANTEEIDDGVAHIDDGDGVVAVKVHRSIRHTRIGGIRGIVGIGILQKNRAARLKGSGKRGVGRRYPIDARIDRRFGLPPDGQLVAREVDRCIARVGDLDVSVVVLPLVNLGDDDIGARRRSSGNEEKKTPHENTGSIRGAWLHFSGSDRLCSNVAQPKSPGFTAGWITVSFRRSPA